MELFDAYPDKKDQMIVMYNNMEPYLKKLMEQGSRVELPLKSIDGVLVDVILCACKHFDHETGQDNQDSLAIIIESERTDQTLFHKHFNKIPEFIAWLATGYHHLCYNKLEDKLCPDTIERLDYNIIKHFPENDRVKMAFEECCVCLSATRATLPCNHFLCKQCEGSIKIPKCPICREYYDDRSSDDE